MKQKERKRPPIYEQRSTFTRKLNQLPIFNYEEMPLDSYDEKELEKIEIPRAVKRILIVLLVCTCGVFFWSYRSDFTIENIRSFFEDSFSTHSEASGFPLKITGSEVNSGNFKFMGNNIVYVSDTSFVVLGASSRQKSVRQHGFSNPALNTSSSYALIYNRGAKSFQIENVYEKLYEHSFDYEIQSADIADNGFYAVATGSQSYLSELTVYSDKNNEKYKYSFSECYICDISISPNGDRVCAAGVKAEGGNLKSIIYIFDINSTEPIVKTEYNDIIAHVELTSNNNAIAIGVEGTAFISVKGLNSYSYDSKTLCSYNINSNDDILLTLASSENGSNCECVILNENGKLKNTFSTGLKIESCKIGTDFIVLLSNSKIYVYSLNGELLKTEEAGSDAKSIILSQTKECYILGLSHIKKILT